MSDERKFKRIGRVAKGEVVLVPMISEPLQDLWDKLEIMKDNGQRAFEAFGEEKNDETGKAICMLGYECRVAEAAFWIALHTQYGHWADELGIRDGYALVQTVKDSGLPPFLRKLKKKLEEGELPGFAIGD